jgi:glyoxylase-like metal-dependent hydrolase (beta-lactamase superfamily II)
MIKKLTDRVYYMPHEDETDRPVLGLVCGDEYSLVVDAGNSPKHAREFLDEIAALEVSPVKYVVITHYHWDHSFGIKEMGLTTIGHQKTKEILWNRKEDTFDDISLEQYEAEGIYSKGAIRCIKNEIPDRKHFSIKGIEIDYKEELEIDLGGIQCVIKAVEGSHTEDSTILYVPQEEVMFLGDCIYTSTKNGKACYQKEKLFSMMEKIEQYEAKYYICSHETICDRAEIMEFWEQLRIAAEITEKTNSMEEATIIFQDNLLREPNENEKFYMNAFLNGGYI